MKNKSKRIKGIVCLILLIILIQAMGYTYAKYIAQDTAKGKAEIAKWSFKIEKEGTETKTIKLANTSLDGKIAPGSHGYIELVLDATGSEVDVDCDVKFTNEKNKPTNLTFTCYGTKYNSISEITKLNGTIKHDAEIPKNTYIISWEWKYETGTTAEEINKNDLIDTKEANSIEEYSFDIIVTATQSK